MAPPAEMVSANPDHLLRYAATATDAGRRLHELAGRMADALVVFRHACDQDARGAPVPDVVVAATDAAGHLQTLAAEVDRVRQAFLALDGTGMPGVVATAPARFTAAWAAVPPSAPASRLDSWRLAEARHTLRTALDGHGSGVRQDDLERIRLTFDRLSGPEADAVLGSLGDDELRRWYGAMHDNWVQGGWPEDRIRELEVMLGEKVSLPTWRRLVRVSGRIDPDPAAALPDRARSTPASRGYFAGLRYLPFEAPLTVGPGTGAELGDLEQGATGDCYLIAAIQAIVRHDPTAPGRMIRPNPNGTFTVTFGDGSREVVSTDLVTDERGTPALGHNAAGAPPELWPLLLEKAYAQRYGGWGATGGGGRIDLAVERLTGATADAIPARSVRIADLAARLRRGEILGMGTIDAPDPDAVEGWRERDAPAPFRGRYLQRLEQNHAFLIVAVDERAGTVTVVNPWAPTKGQVVLTEEELRASIESVTVNTPR